MFPRSSSTRRSSPPLHLFHSSLSMVSRPLLSVFEGDPPDAQTYGFGYFTWKRYSNL